LALAVNGHVTDEEKLSLDPAALETGPPGSYRLTALDDKLGETMARNRRKNRDDATALTINCGMTTRMLVNESDAGQSICSWIPGPGRLYLSVLLKRDDAGEL
jgi:hypothetical protein